MDKAEIQSLIARVALKDRAAFDQLYAKTSARLFGICVRVLPKRGSAEVALQDSLASDVWLVTVARNTAIEHARALKAGVMEPSAPGFELTAAMPDADQAETLTAEAAKLPDCLPTLEEERGDAIRAAYLDGLTYSNLAMQFAVPLNTMRTWFRRGLIALADGIRQ